LYEPAPRGGTISRTLTKKKIETENAVDAKGRPPTSPINNLRILSYRPSIHSFVWQRALDQKCHAREHRDELLIEDVMSVVHVALPT
jgi:hypothetical protein